VWSLDEAEADPIAHPNCVRAFAPILGGGGTGAAAEGEGLGVQLVVRVEPPGLMQLGQRMVRPGVGIDDLLGYVHVDAPVQGKPWHVVPNSAQCPASKPYAVVLDSTGDVVPGGCHATREEADAHVAALYSNAE
jgi:hypothetical protein